MAAAMAAAAWTGAWKCAWGMESTHGVAGSYGTAVGDVVAAADQR